MIMARGPFDKDPPDYGALSKLLGISEPKKDDIGLSALSGLLSEPPKDGLSGIKKSAYDYLNPFTLPPPPSPPPLPKPSSTSNLGIVGSLMLVKSLLKKKAIVIPGRVLPGIENLAVMEGRKIKAAFVYSDLHGFTKLVATQPEGKSFIFLQTFIEIANRITKHYGGEVMDVAGDRVLSVFHRPLGDNSNDPVEDAVTFALWLQAIFKKVIGPEFSGGGLGELSLGIGIDYGEAIVGCVGIRDNKRIVFFGHPANHAAHLQGMAGSVETILSGAADARRPAFLDNGKWELRREKLASGEVILRITDWFAADDPPKIR
jgi:class 3 adenylate cyclase